MNALHGIPLIGSSYVPEGQLVKLGDRILYHERLSVRGKKRRRHGRTNGRRHWKVTVVRYRPDLDRLVAAASDETGAPDA